MEDDVFDITKKASGVDMPLDTIIPEDTDKEENA